MRRLRQAFGPTRWFLGLAAWLLLFEGRAPAQESGRSLGFSTDPDDKAKCERQLNKLYGAIKEYRKEHGDKPPDKLSDLIPDYIHDANLLICPFDRNRGGLGAWKRGILVLSPDPFISYGYEFSPVPVDAYRWRGLPKKTWREIKERQVELVGSVVPIVRCHNHRPWLNLSVGGPIYGSETLYWESNLGEDAHLHMQLANPFSGTQSARAVRPQDFPQRDPWANPQLLDLTASYNATLTNSWQGFASNHLASLSNGIREFDGVRFDVRGVIQLRGTFLPTVFPEQVTGIKVGQKCARVHFLHALSFIYPAGKPQASYSIHYAGGEVREFSVNYGQHIADWWHDPGKPSEPSDATVAWTGQNETTKAYGMELRLYHAVWDNPLKDTEIETIAIKLIPKEHLAGLFLVAITLE